MLLWGLNVFDLCMVKQKVVLRFLRSVLHAKLVRFHNLIEERESEEFFSTGPPSGGIVPSQIDSAASVSC